MIQITLQPEPEGFHQQVRHVGNMFLKKKPQPTTKEFSSHNYWNRFQRETYEAYSRTCAYCCEWIPYPTGVPVIDHFKPKHTYPELAYEWSNYRLASLRFNSRKGHYEDVIDPFELGDNWFVLELPSLMVTPHPELDIATSARVKSTINRLKLNEEMCIESRIRWIKFFIETDSLPTLQERAPFIAIELIRQGLVSSAKIAQIWKLHPSVI